MTDLNKKIINMLKIGASANEIANATGLSNKQLYYRLSLLQLKGFDYQKKYHSDGQIEYTLNQDIQEDTKEISLYTNPNHTYVKMLLLSDLHLGCEYERLDLLNEAYNYCIKNNIHTIINGGDLIDSTLNKKLQNVRTIEEQIDYAIKNHPFDKNIINFICLGNHDYHAYTESGQNLENILQKRRHDIVPLGYGVGILHIKKDYIFVKHPSTPSLIELPPLSNGIMLTGHTHRPANIFNNNFANILLPSLSNIQPLNEQGYEQLPSFLLLTAQFNNKIFNNITLEKFVCTNNKCYKIDEIKYAFQHKTPQEFKIDYNNEVIRESYTKKLELKKKNTIQFK